MRSTRGHHRPVTLSLDRWRVLSPYLDEALSLTGDGRVAWLAAIAARDPGLGADLEGLLAEHEGLEASRYLEGSGAPGQRPADEPVAGRPDRRLLSAARPIGQGGMGSVWLAERCDGRFDARAAIKLLNIALMGAPARTVPARGQLSRPADASAHRPPHRRRRVGARDSRISSSSTSTARPSIATATSTDSASRRASASSSTCSTPWPTRTPT